MSAGEPGSSNYWGVKDPVVDSLIDSLVTAETRADLVSAARALDRMLLHKHLVVPHWYSSTHRVAYQNRLGIPKQLPLYYSADPYVISTWWQERAR